MTDGKTSGRHHKGDRPTGGAPAKEDPSAERQPFSHSTRVSLFVGDVRATRSPSVLHTLLGSCVAVCLFDPTLRAGGMNHILLPACRCDDVNSRCGVHAMELLINQLMKIGGDRRRFVAKAFGGANVLKGANLPAIGTKNAEFVRKFLVTERIPLLAERMGGDQALHVYFETDSGRARVRAVGQASVKTIIDAELRYSDSVAKQPIKSDITLF